jgi:RNA polymerase primary sigma factor
MDAPLKADEESSTSMLDLMQSELMPKPDEELMRESLAKEVERALTTLNKREADILRYYYGLGGVYPLTLEEIGYKFDLTRERVRQIKEKAVRRLRQSARKKVLQNYL